MADSLSLAVAVDVPVLRVWPHVTPASTERLGLLHGRIIWVPSTMAIDGHPQEVLKDIY
jgi:hypothetical protein